MMDLKKFQENLGALEALLARGREALRVLDAFQRLGLPATANGHAGAAAMPRVGRGTRNGRDLITRALREAPRTQSAICERTGMSRQGVSGALHRMAHLGLVSHAGGLWALTAPRARVLKPAKPRAAKRKAAPSGRPHDANMTRERMDALLRLLTERGPLSPQAIYKALPYGASTVNLYPYLNQLKAAGQVTNAGGVWRATGSPS